MSARPPRRRAVLWTLMAVAAVGIAVFAVRPYLSLNPAQSTLPLNPGVAAHFATLVIHAVPGSLALIIGPFQLSKRLRLRAPRLHRIAGRVYMICVLIGAVAATFAATFSVDGLPAQIGFYLLASAWLYTLYRGYTTIRRGDVQMHRVWMIRNYALTFAAATLRIYLAIGLLIQLGVPSLQFNDIYLASVWSSFTINAVIVEYFVINRMLPAMRRRSTPA